MKFGEQSYRSILEAAIARQYEFVDFLTADFGSIKSQIILRHDTDFSWAMAHEMAKIDASYKIKSTFTVLLSCRLYNPLTPDNTELIHEIHQLGHNIVLHHAALLSQSAYEIRQSMAREIEVMRAFFPYIQPVFVWHNPSINKPPRNMQVSGMTNAYSDDYTERMKYISDSYLNRPEVFLSALGEHKLLHFVLHPFVWISEKDDIVSMFSHTLNRIIRECDKEFRLHPSWMAKFPNGITEEPLDKLEEFLNKS